MTSKLRGLVQGLRSASNSLLPKKDGLQMQQARTGFNSIPMQYGNPPDRNLPDDHDRMFMDGTAHPEPILDYHWYVNEERGRPLLWWIAGQAVFFAFSIGVGYLGMQLLPGGFVVNGERPAMDYEPFGDHYLERGGDPHRIPAHVYRHVKDQLPEGHAVEIIRDPIKLNDVAFASYNKDELPASYTRKSVGYFPILHTIPGMFGYDKPPSMRWGEHWYPHPEGPQGQPIIGGLPLTFNEEDLPK